MRLLTTSTTTIHSATEALLVIVVIGIHIGLYKNVVFAAESSSILLRPSVTAAAEDGRRRRRIRGTTVAQNHHHHRWSPLMGHHKKNDGNNNNKIDSFLFWETIDQESSTRSDQSLLLRIGGQQPTYVDLNPLPVVPGVGSSDNNLRGANQQQQQNEVQLLSSSNRSLGMDHREDDTSEDHYWPATAPTRHRLIIKCNIEDGISQEDCLSNVMAVTKDDDDPSSVHVIHNLAPIHAYSVSVNDKARDALFAAVTTTTTSDSSTFTVHSDFTRHPLVLEGSMKHRRDLEDGSAKQEIPWGVEHIRATGVWDEFGIRGEGIRVCILDTGVDSSHEDFVGLDLSGYSGDESTKAWDDYSNRGHGTHILGIIAATDNDIGIVGVAPDVEAFVVRVFTDDGDFDDFTQGGTYSSDLIAAAMICVERGAHIISASLGGPTYDPDEDEFFRSIRESYNIITVAASGNSGSDREVYPASYDSVLSVGASTRDNVIADFSTVNAFTDVLAPGVEITSTYPGNKYRSFTGTSMAAPFVTGALALMLNYKNFFKPESTIETVLDSLKATVAWKGSTGVGIARDGDFSQIGVIDVYSAIHYLANYEQPPKCSNEVRLEVATDSKGSEIAYRLKRMSDDTNIWVERPGSLRDNEVYTYTACLDLDGAGGNDCFRFDVRDTGGDGIAGNGIDLFYRGEELYRGGNFGVGGSLTFGDNC